jgi:hypothetical protein
MNSPKLADTYWPQSTSRRASERGSLKGGSSAIDNVPRSLHFADGRIILPAKDLVALESASNQPVWTVRHLGKISGLLIDKGSILGAAGRNAFAIDALSGTVRWKMSAKSNFTNPVLLPEQNAVILCNKTDLLIIETSSGKVLRQAKTNLDENPITLRRIGKEFVLATRAHASTLFNISGERFSDEPIIETTFPPVSFAVSQPFPPVGTREVHEDFRDQLEANWNWLDKASANGPGQSYLSQLQLALGQHSSRGEIYAARVNGHPSWALWRINPVTGVKEEFEISGVKPDADPVSGLLYFVQRDTLRALRLPDDSPTVAVQ